jgi:Na+/H+ antiporter NhaA
MAVLGERPFAGRTAWTRSLQTPLRRFLQTETASAAFLLAAALLGLLWVNVDQSSYDSVWHTELSIRLGGSGVSQDLREWINNGLMTFFFFVVGLEARREFDVGELRERRRAALPTLAGVGGMAGAALLYLALNAGHDTAHGWGVAMSTDTAFALGMLALVGPRFPQRLRTFILTVAVVDDLLALVVIATVYSEDVRTTPLLIAVGLFALVPLLIRLGVRHGLIYFLLGAGAWVALYKAGIDPLVIGLAMGLVTFAAPAGRDALERATDLFRSFREQPTSELAREAQVGLASAVSPNERLQALYHPWTSYVIVPLFALVNAGIPINSDMLSRAAHSRVTLGIVLGYVVGKPVAIVAVSWLVTTLSRGRLRPTVGWAAVAGGGAIAGIGFTVSLLIASLAFQGQVLEEAKAGVLAAATVAAALSWTMFRATALLPAGLRDRLLLGSTAPIIDLADPVDPGRDHTRGPRDAPVTIVEYGDFECPYCGQAEPVVRELLRMHGDDIRYVWRHLPLSDVHPNAQLAAEASEAASEQGAFWAMHDLLLDHQDRLRFPDLVGYAEELGLDVERFTDDLRQHVHADRVAQDIDTADLSSVSGTPTFFINNLRHYGAYDIDSLTEAVRGARARAALPAGSAR